MNLTIQRKCLQCGGEMEIQETDTRIECPWCGVRHFIDTARARYVLPHKEIKGELIYVPYLRLKGSLYSCDEAGVHFKVIDTTVSATSINVLPHTLGLRPQTLGLQFAQDATGSTFLKHQMKWHEAIKHASSVQHLTSKATLHQEWIGESFSTIYQPLIIQDDIVIDGVTGDKLAKIPEGKDIFAAIRMDHLGWHMPLLPTLCPNCGWDMQSEQASVVHLCHNCETCWRNEKGTFVAVHFSTLPTDQPEAIYLPFWHMTTDIDGIKLKTLADFIKIMNIPRGIKPEWQEIALGFICPAFKIRPKIFLRIASQLTTAQCPFSADQSLPDKTTAISLNAHDAEESIKLILGHSAVAKRNIMPLLPKISHGPVTTTLLFLPFFDNGYELCQKEFKIVINKQILKWGEKL